MSLSTDFVIGCERFFHVAIKTDYVVRVNQCFLNEISEMDVAQTLQMLFFCFSVVLGSSYINQNVLAVRRILHLLERM